MSSQFLGFDYEFQLYGSVRHKVMRIRCHRSTTSFQKTREKCPEVVIMGLSPLCCITGHKFV